MCFFVCLALPKNHVSKLGAVSHIFDVIDASDWSIGKAVCGNPDRDGSYLITAGGCSCFISTTKDHRFEAPKLIQFESLIRSLVQQLPSLSILLHYAYGDISREQVTRKNRRLVPFSEICGRFDLLEFDVRYVIKGFQRVLDAKYG